MDRSPAEQELNRIERELDANEPSGGKPAVKRGDGQLGGLWRRKAEASAAAAARELGQPRSGLKVELRQAARFWPAEGYHQNYAENNAVKYNFYRFSCGRDRRLDSVWGDNARSDNAWVK